MTERIEMTDSFGETESIELTNDQDIRFGFEPLREDGYSDGVQVPNVRITFESGAALTILIPDGLQIFYEIEDDNRTD